jgi:mycofactocin biosynthetic radical S-adenosylmethionine protein MftC
MTVIKRVILKKELFGGIYLDTSEKKFIYLRDEEYEQKKVKLQKFPDDNTKVEIIDVRDWGYSLLKDTTSSPYSIFLELTKHCNGKCTDCYMDSNALKWNQNDISFSEIKEIIRQFAELGGYSIRLTGGEPTQRDDFFDIIDLLNEKGLVIGLNTNGIFDQKTLEQILFRGIKDIRISIDGPEKVNDKLRWPGNFRGAVKTIEGIAEYNKTALNPVKPTINVVLMKSNLSQIEFMIKLARDYGCKISFGLLRLSGRADSHEMLTPEDVATAACTVQRIKVDWRLPQGMIRINYDIFCNNVQNCEDKEKSIYIPYPFDNSKCPMGISNLNIDAYGRIAPCGYFVNADEIIGEDIRGKNLLHIWHNSPLFIMIRNLKRTHCISCDYYKVKCNGGCPAMAYFFNGDLNSKDPYCIRDVNISRYIQE